MSFRRSRNVLLLCTLCSLSAVYFTACSNNSATPVAQVSETQTSISNMKAGDVIPNQYLVVFSANGVQSSSVNTDAMIQSTCASIGLPASAVLFSYRDALHGFCATMTSSQVGQLQKDSRIAYIEPDRVVKLEPCTVISDKTSNSLQSQTTPWGITKVGGAGNGSLTTIGHRAWIIDTGIDLTHSDLTVDVTRSKTFITSGQDAQSANDLHGHGTHVAGIIAAKNNTIGVVGVAAGATVVAIKVLDASGSGTTSGVIAGIDWVRTHASAGEPNQFRQ